VTGWCCDFDQFYQPVKKSVSFAVQEKAGFDPALHQRPSQQFWASDFELTAEQ
jgi:hypothetical protein